MELNDPLNKEDVELRVGTTSPKGFSLLLYKTARTDVKRLEQVYPMLWKNRYFYDAKNLLCCEISVYNKELKEWITRVDVGVESRTEKEKGSYSDSFKRAGFKFDIGTELYNSPFIWVNWQMKTEGSKHTPVGFYSSNLEITKYEVKDGKVIGLTINYNGKVIYQTGKRIESTKSTQTRINYTEEAKKYNTVDSLGKWFKSLTEQEQKEASKVVMNRKNEMIEG